MLHFDKEKKTQEFELIKAGRYEVILNAEWKKDSYSDDMIILCTYRVRKDVEQEAKNRLVFDRIKKDKNGEYHAGKINAILAAIPNSQTDFESYDELVQYLNDKLLNVKITVVKANPDYPNSKDRNSVEYYSTEETKFPELKNDKVSLEITGKSNVEEPKSGGLLPQIEEDDLPF